MRCMAGIFSKLLEIQRDLKVEKKRWNSFGGFFSRSKEDILEAIKPLAHERGCVVICNDEAILVTDKCEKCPWVYIKATAMLIDEETGETVSADGLAREPESKPKMDSSQTTGSASSYAGKRALGNLFAIDDTADSDQMPEQQPEGPFDADCTACGQRWMFANADQMAQSACTCGNRQFRRA